MQNLTVSIPHQLGRAEARRRIEEQIRQVRQQHGGFVSRLEETWTGDTLAFTAVVMAQRLTGRVWERGPATRRQITDALYPGGGPAHYTTVQKLLERLEAKGCVARRQAEGVLTFAATLGREELISRRLLDVADKLCGGSVTPLLMNLVRSRPLSAGELEELQGLLRELRRQQGRPRGPR
jgi:predicted transcriptional regulator